ncbi:MAG: pyruvate kinase [Candidatus Ancillula trichonymphae]|jgi:pyruvate kinase|nr:pyruvate kinase [Candidatus Ancillula trichonymphae]
MRKAKIVCTIGPATESLEQVVRLAGAGMDVARLNRSHGDSKTHEVVYNNIREVASKTGRNVAVLVDLQGPKIRLGKFKENKKYELLEDDIVVIATEDILGERQPNGDVLVSTTYKGLPGDVKVGDPLLIDDGKVRLEAVEVTNNFIRAKAVVAGTISNNKGINLPWAAVAVPALSEKDKDDLRWAVRVGADIVALSFVRSAKDYEDAWNIMNEEGRILPVVAKIEKPQAVDNLEEVVKAFDGIMVARGDLGVELPLEVVPLIQKRCIDLSRQYGKPVIVATQVLETMTNNPMPTRAEVSDCANAILDGADATMTSGETSVGEYPILTIETMARISDYQTANGLDSIPKVANPSNSDGGAIILSAVETATRLGTKVIVVLTSSGNSAHLVSRLRPNVPIIALTDNEHTRASLALSWGVESFLIDELKSADDILSVSDATLRKNGLATDGDTIVVLSGTPIGKVGSTNTISVHRVGEYF